MASLETNPKPSGSDDFAHTGGLIEGRFDVDSLLAQLTIEEKASLLSGIIATCSVRLKSRTRGLTIRRKGLLAYTRDPQIEDSINSHF